MQTMKFLVVIISSLALSPVWANKAYQIAKDIEKANEGFIGDSSQMEMLLINGDKKIVRSMESKTAELSDTEARTMLEFLLPKDVKGTKLLTWSFDQDDDSQWIYLPAFRKVKRISSSSKTSSFMGSEFTYEDLRAASPEKYNFKFIKEEKVDGDTIWTYERTSKKKSGYSKQVVKASKKYMAAIAVDYYDRSKQLLKKAVMSKFQQFSVGKKSFWYPSQIKMTNLQTKKESILNWKNRKLGTKFNKRDFTKRELKK